MDPYVHGASEYSRQCLNVSRSKYDFDVVGHYARPDIFQLHVNEKATRPVTIE